MMRTKMTCIFAAGLAILALACAPQPALANAIVVTNLALVSTDQANGTADIEFDLSWSNSWRSVWDEAGASITNWDAAWVFIKYRETGGEWQHARLASSGHTPAAGCAIDVGSSGSGTNVGAFVYRSTNGYGALSAPATRLRWHYADTGLTITNEIEVSVHAVEMVYVAEGSFSVGSGGIGDFQGSFTDGSWTSGVTISFQITNEAAILITNAAGCLWGTVVGGNCTIGDAGTLSSDFPKGYAAFYCMKYEITQGQYADFLNKLTATQAANRYSSASTGYRYTIGTNSAGVFTNGVPDRACNWLSMADGMAYADWAGLRPMTELEFEKACRGPVSPVANEYTWGNTTISATTAIENDGTGTDTATGGNCNYNTCSPDGPYRVGIYATASSTREAAGASYWGIMELSGNLWERPMSVGTTAGRVFTGLHGNGNLAVDGTADVSNWQNGAGIRGGSWDYASWSARVGCRYLAAQMSTSRINTLGWRGVRLAPVGVGP